MSEHKRRDGYWQYYEPAKETEAPHPKRTLIEIIRENSCPRTGSTTHGRPPVHSRDKLDFMCLWMMANNKTYRETESDMRDTRTPWEHEPTPDHTTLVRHMQTIPEDWMDAVLAETARRCLAEAGDAAGPVASDSSALETTRYEEIGRPDMKGRDFVQVRQKIYWKYHIAAVLGLHIVLAAFGTPGNVNDTVMLRTMLAEIRSRGFGGFAGGSTRTGGTTRMPTARWCSCTG